MGDWEGGIDIIDIIDAIVSIDAIDIIDAIVSIDAIGN